MRHTHYTLRPGCQAKKCAVRDVDQRRDGSRHALPLWFNLFYTPPKYKSKAVRREQGWGSLQQNRELWNRYLALLAFWRARTGEQSLSPEALWLHRRAVE